MPRSTVSADSGSSITAESARKRSLGLLADLVRWWAGRSQVPPTIKPARRCLGFLYLVPPTGTSFVSKPVAGGRYSLRMDEWAQNRGRKPDTIGRCHDCMTFQRFKHARQLPNLRGLCANLRGMSPGRRLARRESTSPRSRSRLPDPRWAVLAGSVRSYLPGHHGLHDDRGGGRRRVHREARGSREGLARPAAAFGH